MDCLEQALQAYGTPEIFNTDQGCQFTSEAFTGVLKAHSIAISMDGRGRALDNIFVERLWRSVKHEDVYLNGYATLPDLLLGLAGMAPGPNTSRPHPQHKIYPYLLRGVDVVRPNQVWSTDITYIRLARGFAYLVAVIDWYSRKVLSWRLSNTLDSRFCVDCLEQALRTYGVP